MRSDKVVQMKVLVSWYLSKNTQSVYKAHQSPVFGLGNQTADTRLFSRQR